VTWLAEEAGAAACSGGGVPDVVAASPPECYTVLQLLVVQRHTFVVHSGGDRADRLEAPCGLHDRTSWLSFPRKPTKRCETSMRCGSTPIPRAEAVTAFGSSGYSHTATAVLTVILVRKEGGFGWYGANGWRSNSTERRMYEEMSEDE
jgi:hypothetical protein